MANVVKKHSISYELAQKMADAAVAKARELGVTENVAILDDGGNLKTFSRMDGAPIPTIEMAQNKAYTAQRCYFCMQAKLDSLAFDLKGRYRSDARVSKMNRESVPSVGAASSRFSIPARMFGVL
jgi:uncharacterized protein GlcG (DUF336 family)